MSAMKRQCIAKGSEFGRIVEDAPDSAASRVMVRYAAE